MYIVLTNLGQKEPTCRVNALHIMSYYPYMNDEGKFECTVMNLGGIPVPYEFGETPEQIDAILQSNGYVVSK